MRRINFLLIAGILIGCSKGTPTSLPVEGDGITLAFGGDVMLGRWVDVVIRRYGPLYIWGDVIPLIKGADLSFVNLECVIASSGEPFFPPRVFYFKAAPEAVEALKVAGIDYVTLSNNHAMDFRGEALLECIKLLEENGIAHAGAGRNLEEASKYALLESRGLKVGVVAFADHFVEYAATEKSPGTNVIPITTEERYFRRVKESIKAVKDAGADIVVFSIHWGPNMRHVPSPEFVEFAHAVMDAGADIFHGHSAHVFQGIEIYKGKPIFFDTGDLIDDYYVSEVHRNDQQLLFLVHINREGIVRIELVPLLIHLCQVNRAEGPVFDEIFERIKKLSGAMGTEVKREGDRLVIDVAGRW